LPGWVVRLGRIGDDRPSPATVEQTLAVQDVVAGLLSLTGDDD
jgi:hypothetical protein